MRTTATCPKCAGKKMVVAQLRSLQGSDNTHHYVPVPALAWKVGQVVTEALHLGTFESWICAACGYTELYAKDLHHLEQFAAERPNDIRIVDAGVPERGPFR